MVSKRRGAGLIAIAVIALFISLDPPRQYFLPEPIALGCLLFFGWCFLSHLGVWDFAAFILQDEPDRFSCGMSYKTAENMQILLYHLHIVAREMCRLPRFHYLNTRDHSKYPCILIFIEFNRQNLKNV